jgi:hypothetical protein
MTEDELNARIEAELNAQIDAELQAEVARKRMEIARRQRREAASREYDRINARHPIQGPGDPKAEAARRAAMAPLRAMRLLHDEIYGDGTGRRFLRGAYLKDLPRAVRERISDKMESRMAGTTPDVGGGSPDANYGMENMLGKFVPHCLAMLRLLSHFALAR